MKLRTIIMLLSGLIFSQASFGQEDPVHLKNIFSFHNNFNFSDPPLYGFGLQHIPTLSISAPMKKNRLLDTEVSFNSFINFNFRGPDYDETAYNIKLYRLWLRYSTPRLEIRAGLQKISFGTAAIFRPLMWFDKLDFRDPLQLTDGVYALLGRYYFQGNVNIWLWGLYGNEGTKGWEIAPTSEKEPEYGGRLQIPLFKGETGMSFHHRQADFSKFYIMPTVYSPFFSQDCLGIDAKWDIGPGIWFEYVLKHNDKDNVLFEEFEHYINLGTDYTFSLGNGLNITAEYFRHEGTKTSNFAALAVNYPFGLMNRLVSAVYFNWESKDWYRFISIRRDYNYWSFQLIGFWNPDEAVIFSLDSEQATFTGKGIQLMATVNF